MKRIIGLVLVLLILFSTPALAAETGTFVVKCTPSHVAQVDPIVAPGPSGTLSGHVHQFFGNRSIASDSTYDSMTAASTTCKHPGDTAGYWVPQILNAQGQPVPIKYAAAYYKIEPGDVAFPPDLRMIAGGVGQESRTFWDCFSGGGHFSAPPSCAANDTIEVRISFPSCGDGRLDSPDHRSHMAYPVKGVCPASHPINFPRINFFVRTLCTGTCVYGGRLSDGTTTLHADFWNTWQQATLVELIDRCRIRNCGVVTS